MTKRVIYWPGLWGQDAPARWAAPETLIRP